MELPAGLQTEVQTVLLLVKTIMSQFAIPFVFKTTLLFLLGIYSLTYITCVFVSFVCVFVSRFVCSGGRASELVPFTQCARQLCFCAPMKEGLIVLHLVN